MNDTTARGLTLFDRLILFLATGLGVGSVPGAPGTVGSLLGLPLAWGLDHLPVEWRCAAAAAIFAAGVPICGHGAKLLRAKDPGSIVFDEIAAFPVIYAFASFGWISAIAGFILFRLFDIVKIWPAGPLERLPGGLGIMADDAAAGAYAGVSLWILLWLLPS